MMLNRRLFYVPFDFVLAPLVLRSWSSTDVECPERSRGTTLINFENEYFSANKLVLPVIDYALPRSDFQERIFFEHYFRDGNDSIVPEFFNLVNAGKEDVFSRAPVGRKSGDDPGPRLEQTVDRAKAD